MIRCTICGNDNPAEANFCELCGKSLEKEREAGLNACPGGAVSPEQAAAPPRALLRSQSTGREYRLYEAGDARLGRGDPARGISPEVELSDGVARAKGVSRLHAVVYCAEQTFYIVDLNSTNGTYINGIRLVPQRPHPLSDGDEIRLGEYELTFHYL